MVKAEIVDAAVKATGTNRRLAAVCIERIFRAMTEALARGERIELRGFGVFRVKRRKRGVARDLSHHCAVAISPAMTVRFKAGKELRKLPPPAPRAARKTRGAAKMEA